MELAEPGLGSGTTLCAHTCGSLPQGARPSPQKGRCCEQRAAASSPRLQLPEASPLHLSAWDPPITKACTEPITPGFHLGHAPSPTLQRTPQPAEAQPLPKAACSGSGALWRGFVLPPAWVEAPSGRAEPSGASSPGTQLTLLRQRLPELGKPRLQPANGSARQRHLRKRLKEEKGCRERKWPQISGHRAAGSTRGPALALFACPCYHGAISAAAAPGAQRAARLLPLLICIRTHCLFQVKHRREKIPPKLGTGEQPALQKALNSKTLPSSACSEAAATLLRCRQAPEPVPTPWHSYWHRVVPGGSHGTTFPGGNVFPFQPLSVVPSGEPSTRAGLQDAGTLTPGVLLVVSPTGAAPGAAGCL